MAGNNIINNQKVYVQTDYENIIIIDPNKVVDGDNNIQERLVNHEELVKYVNLEAKVLPRTKLVVGDNFDDTVQNLRVGSMSADDQRKINFMFPEGKDGFDTSWSDEITGLNALQGKGLNQTQLEQVGEGENKKVVRKISNSEDTQLLGITNVNVKINTAFAPQVTIEMVDVQGRTLFEQGENSPYSAFFQLPYPLFILTIKGYFGKAVRYELMLKDFNARFDSSDGNYKITTNYIARTYAILSDISIHNLYVLPHMYQRTAEIGTSTTNTKSKTTGISTKEISTIQSTKGIEILKQVYSDYRSKGLIGDDFPTQQNYPLTLPVLEKKLENFERYIMESYGQEDMTVLNDISEFTNHINDYRNKIFTRRSEWFDKYIDSDNVLIETGENKPILYPFKKEIDVQGRRNALSELKKIINEYNGRIQTNTTFGIEGECTIDNEKIDSSLEFSMSEKLFFKTIDGISQIDVEKTYSKRKKSPPNELEKADFTRELINSFFVDGMVLDGNTLEVDVESSSNTFIIFGDVLGSADLATNTFLSKLKNLDDRFQKQKEIVETKLSVALGKKIKSPSGLGFNPTIKNIMAVICANADAFFRLMDNVHENSWNMRDNPIRLRTILGTDKSLGIEGKDTVIGTNDNSEIIYPWPQYFETNFDDNGNIQYEDKYPGDINSINTTQGYRYDVWPEVEFVEEYIKGSVEIVEQETNTDYSNELGESPYINSNAIEFPFKQYPYTNKSIVPFFYEIFERTLITSTYTNFYKKSGYNNSLYSVFGEFEKLNISESISDSYDLIEKLKNFGFSYENLLTYLESISKSGSWNLYLRDEYVTGYIKNLVEKDYGVYRSDEVDENSISVDGATQSIDKLKKYLTENYSNEVGFLDKFPFTNLSWIKNNLSEGYNLGNIEKANSTTKIYSFLESKKTISTFSNEDEEYDKKVFTYFEWILNNANNPNQQTSSVSETINNSISPELNTNNGLINYYVNRTQNKQILTESTINYGETFNRTTSLLNTPYFVNALLKGVENHKNGNINPYVGLGYLYLNSLPLSTLREKFKTYREGVTTNLDYIFAGLNKFSAIHKLPYLWILKYGSLWHRYKTKVENNTDILDGIWESFDYVGNYDPITNNSEKQYTLKNQIGDEINYKQKSVQTTTSLTPQTVTLLNNGVYPKLINSVYWYFTQKDIFTNYTSQEFTDAYDIRKLITIKSDFGKIEVTSQDNLVNPNNQLNVYNWVQYFEVKGNSEFDLDISDNDNLLLVPSTGLLKFNESKLNCLNSENKLVEDIVDNESVYNGTARCLWGSPNFGYFDNSKFIKPTTIEYLKSIDANIDNKQSFDLCDGTNKKYSVIEDMFNVFTKDMLDTFEEYFLNFCQTKEKFDSTTEGGDISLYDIMKSLFIVEKPSLGNNVNENIKNITNNQLNYFVQTHKSKFLSKEIVLKIGNPGKFNRKIYNSFSDEPTNEKLDRYDFGKYSQGNPVPTEGGVTYLQSYSISPEIWKSLFTYVGKYEQEEYQYKDSGSYITDFFIDMDVEFTTNNIILLQNIIKLYASKKLENNNISKEEFMTEFNSFLNEQKEFQNNILNNTFIGLNNTLPNVSVTQKENEGKSKIDGEESKLELWKTFQTMNDKWVAGQDFKTRTIFEDFLFLDRANRPIGDKVIINIEELRSKLKNRDSDMSVYSLMGFIYEKNNFVFMPTPVYANFYGNNDRTSGSEPKESDGSQLAQDLFGTYMEVDTRDTRPRMLGIYVGEPSSNLDFKDNKNVRKNNDAFDITIPSGNPLIENQENKTDYSESNRCVGFNVQFGTRNQGIFKSVSLDMKQHKNIAPTFQVLSDLGSQSSGQKAAQQSQSMYNFYRSKSYTCQITSMGNAMIQPTMYFNLERVPLFYGPYLIMNVNHSITPTDFVTQFEGIRISKFSLKQPDKLVMSVYRDILNTYKRKLLAQEENISTGSTENETSSNNNQISVDMSRCEGLSKFPLLPYEDFNKTIINANQIITYLNSQNDLNEDMKIYMFGISMKGKNSINVPNNNIFGINLSSNSSVPAAMVNSYVKSQCCIKQNTTTFPIAVYETYNDSLNMSKEMLKNQQTLLNDLRNASNPTSIDSRATSMARLLFKNAFRDKITATNAQGIKGQINDFLNTNPSNEENYNMWVDIFKNAINKLS